jgi:glutamine cyclotransferase
LISSCVSDNDDNNEIKKPLKTKIPVKITSPANETQYNLNETVNVIIEVNDSSKISSMQLFVADTLFADNLEIKSQTIEVPTENGLVGFVDYYLAYNDDQGKPHRDNRILTFFSDSYPEQKRASILNTYPHAKSSYTQGLEFYNGKLFESTGQKGSSLIAEVDLTTGNQYRFKDLNPQYFGEGITILNDTIYQLTWQSNVCFIYDMDFNKISEFNYEGEGWGLCNNGKSLIMTNGSSEIVWRNPQTFEIEKRIYAFESQTDVPMLNELELINGNLFINVFTENKVIEVDTTTGKVLSYVDCSAIAAEGVIDGANVLNGIAYNPLTGKTYMTGKLWPKLFEVKIE